MSRDDLRAAAAEEIARWERQVTDELLRLFERQEAVVLARLQGVKARKHTRHWEPPGERKVDPSYVLDTGRWVLDAVGSVAPPLRRLYSSVFGRVRARLLSGQAPPPEEEVDLPPELEAQVQARLQVIAQMVQAASQQVQEAITQGEADGEPMPEIVKIVRSTYEKYRQRWADRIAAVNVTAAVNEGSLAAAIVTGAGSKQWLSSRDDRVRETHQHADGQVRPLLDAFEVGGFGAHPLSLLLYPGDPRGPIDEIANCRCTMLFTRPVQAKDYSPAQPRFSAGTAGGRGGQFRPLFLPPSDPGLDPTVRAVPKPRPKPPEPQRGPRPIRSRALPSDRPGPSGDFAVDSERVDRLQQAYMADRVDTQSLYSRGGRWSPERYQQQREVIDHFLTRPGVRADRKVLVLGGLPGAGKTTFLNSPQGQATVGADLSEYVVVNPDEVKSEMIRRGMVPDYPGLTPEESATMYHAESFEIALSVMRKAGRRGLNFVYDTTLKSPSQLGFTQSAAQSPPPWTTTVVMVDVPLSTAKARAVARYQSGDRYTPLGFIDGQRSFSPGFASRSAESFAEVRDRVDRWVQVDNSGAAPVVVGTGGGRRRVRA